MALNDLLDSIERVAEALDRIDAAYSGHFREIKTKIEEARSGGRTDIVKYILITDVVDDFRVGMGDWLYDSPLQPPPGMTKDEARRIIDEYMDDLFFNFLFWDTEIKVAHEKYEQAMKRYDFDGAPRVLFNYNSEWFEDWSDWGKLITDPEIAGAYRTKDYLKPR